ncbi:glycosyltransferase [Novosphingobium sp. BW1]|uniref:glycosyltransferase n=1 Tax=Novosphingobium sp. BW1 TaxID=2592621 RepID=UPI0011DECA75|nr:glycosyltransferase [Novosphingobium sp. BW1]TYC90273.1 glycosyltransferase [Novosphingobium sp. BW1]
MKVLYVVPPSTHFAGMERVVHDLACGLARRYRRRIEVSVLYCHRYVELPESLPYEVLFEQVGSLRAFPRKVARQLGRDRYDVVVIAQFEPTVLVWMLHRLARGKTRFVMHLHGNPKVEGTTSRRARLAFSLFNLLVPRMDKVIAVSPALARYLASRTGHADVADYLPNPVRQFGEVVRTAGSGGPVRFLTIGRLARQKGHDVLIEAFAQLIAQGIDAHLTIVGDGEEQDALSAQIGRLGLACKVRLAGKIAYPAAELAEAECFVSASRWEGFGVAIVEAMSAGLPVIATDCDFGPTDLIDMPEKGEVVPAEDVGALAAAMAGFAARARSRAEESVRREAAAFFRLDNVVAQHAAMLEGLAWRGDVVRG